MASNLLLYGDNLEILRNRIPSESVDLVYLDPPFNSNRSYNVLFGDHKKPADQAQIEAFDDTWTWTPDTDRIYFELINGAVPMRVADALRAFHQLMGEGDVLAYLVMMAPRLVELHRGAETYRLPLPPLRPHGEPLPKSAYGCDLRQHSIPQTR